MMNVKTVFGTLFCLILSGQAYGQDQRSGFTDFIIEGSTLIEYQGNAEYLVIPENLGIREIADDAFTSSRIRSVIISANVDYIGEWTFNGCDNLTSIIVDEQNAVYSSAGGVLFNKDKTVLYQYPLAREGAYTVPIGVLHISDFAFVNCVDLSDLSIPASVSSVPAGVFSGCGRLTNITVDVQNDAYSSIGGVLFNKDRTVLIQYPAGREGAYTIPNGVLHIEDYAFLLCEGLTAVNIPAGVITIGDMAFTECVSLSRIIIPAGVTSIGDYAFSRCERLVAVSIPVGVISIGGGAFSGCLSLASVIIPAGISLIGTLTFYDCWNLTSITIPLGVTDIGMGAFFNCFGLTSITIPQGVTTIREFAFSGCESLTSVIIPASVSSIGASAFSWCTGLETVTLSRHTQIGEYAFPDEVELVYRD
jgi:hypothetical protein